MKIKYIIQWFYTTPRNSSGNVYSFVRMTDTRSGRTLAAMDVPESNARVIPFWLNGGKWAQDYYFCSKQLSKREYKWFTDANVKYISCDPATLAAAFLKEIRRRKPVVSA